MKLELRHIHCILAVAKHRHFARAADDLGLLPPSLTKQIQDAEKLLGFRLFDRTRRSVSLTAAGEVYVPVALEALAKLEQASQLGQLAVSGQLGRVRIGYVASAAFAGVLHDTVAGFRDLHPRVDVSLSETPMDEIPKMLLERQLDVAYVRPPLPLPDEILLARVYQDDFVVALPSDSKLTSFDTIAPQQLRKALFAVPEQESGTFEVARRGRFQPILGPRSGQLIAVLTNVALGGYVAIIPRAWSIRVHLPGVEYRPISGAPIPSEISLAYRRHERTRVVAEFVRYTIGQGKAAAGLTRRS